MPFICYFIYYYFKYVLDQDE